MDKKQVKLVNWMYNMNVLDFILHNGEQAEGDIQKLRESIMRVFPEHWFDIVRPLE